MLTFLKVYFTVHTNLVTIAFCQTAFNNDLYIYLSIYLQQRILNE